MANNITIDARLDTFFDASVDNLKDDHYVEHGSVCDICRADDMADPPEIIEHARAAPAVRLHVLFASPEAPRAQ